MKKLLICAMTAGLFMMGGVQESAAFGFKKAKKSEDTDTSVKKKRSVSGLFKKKSNKSVEIEDSDSEETLAEDENSEPEPAPKKKRSFMNKLKDTKNKIRHKYGDAEMESKDITDLDNAIASLRKWNKIFRGKGDEKLTKRTKANASRIEKLYHSTNTFLDAVKRLSMSGRYSLEEGNNVAKIIREIKISELSDQDRGWFRDYQVNVKELGKVIFRLRDSYDYDKDLKLCSDIILNIDEALVKTLGSSYVGQPLASSNNDYEE